MSGEKALKVVADNTKPVSKAAAGVATVKEVAGAIAAAEAVAKPKKGHPAPPIMPPPADPNSTFKGVKEKLPTGEILAIVKGSGDYTARFGELRNKRENFFTAHRGVTEKPVLSEVLIGQEYTEKDFEKEETGLFILGLKLKPVQLDVQLGGTTTQPYKQLPDQFGGQWFNYRLNTKEMEEGVVFDLYQFELEGQVHSFLMDRESKAWIDKDITHQLVSHWEISSNNVEHNRGAGVILHKAKVTNCVFFNNVTLIGGTYERCLISDSTVVALPKKERPDYHFGVNSYGSSNATYKNTYLERSTINRSKIDQGNYVQAHIYDSTLDSRSQVQVKEVTIRNSLVRGNERLTLNYVNLTSCHIGASGYVQVANQTLRDFSLRGENLYAPNKMSITEIDVPNSRYRDMQMVRIDAQTMQVSSSMGGNESFKFKLADDQWDIRTKLEEWLLKAMHINGYESETNAKVSDDPLMKSIIRYVSDTIMSRVQIIKTVGSAVDMSDQLESRDSTRNFNSWASRPF